MPISRGRKSTPRSINSSGSAEPGPLPPKQLSRRKLLSSVAILVVGLTVGMLVSRPSIATPAFADPRDPFSLTVTIHNETLLPFRQIEYTCDATTVELVSGSPPSDYRAVGRGFARILRARQAIRAECGVSYPIAAPLKKAEYRLSMLYSSFPWLTKRTLVQDFSAQLNANGQIEKWVGR
jgi:hypothetical protein